MTESKQTPPAASDNPYQAPLLEDSAAATEPASLRSANAEEIRLRLIHHEASIKGISWFYAFGGVITIALGALAIVGLRTESPVPFWPVALIIVLALLQLVAAYAIRQLRGWAPIAAGIVSGAGLLVIPVGTILHGYFLYLIFCQKGQEVFSPGYLKVIEATPHIKCRTPMMIWVLLVIMFLGLLYFVAG